MRTKALVPYYGAARMTGPKIGEAIGSVKYLSVPCCASVLGRLHSEAEFKLAKDCVLARRSGDLFDRSADAAPDEERAADYFALCWMGRSAVPGTAQEARNTFSFRLDAGGGGSAVRYFNAVRSLREWRQVLANTTFKTRKAADAISEMIGSSKNSRDAERKRFRAIYVDPPWFDAGDDYLFPMTDLQHAALAASLALAAARGIRVIVRINDHEMTRGLYPASSWIYKEVEGRDQANQNKVELILVAREGWRLLIDGE